MTNQQIQNKKRKYCKQCQSYQRPNHFIRNIHSKLKLKEAKWVYKPVNEGAELLNKLTFEAFIQPNNMEVNWTR